MWSTLELPLARFRNVIDSGLNLDLATSIAFLITSRGRLLFVAKRSLEPLGNSRDLGILPFGVKSIVINGLGFNNTWCLRRCLSGSLVVRCCGYRSEATCDNASRALIKINPSELYSGSYKPYCSRQKY